MGYSGYLAWAWNERPEGDCSKSIDNHLNQALKELKLPGQAAPEESATVPAAAPAK